MRKIILPVLFLVCTFILLPSISWAGYCGNWGSSGSNPWTVSSDAGGTASCERADVVACIDTYATYGDTINVPTDSCTWTNSKTLSKGMTIQGAGVGNTVISSNGVTIFAVSPDATSMTNDYLFRITGFTFNGNYTGKAINVETTNLSYSTGDLIPTEIRIDNNRFTEWAVGVEFDKLGYGLVDNNYFFNCIKAFNSYGYYSYSWAREPTAQNSLGTVYSVYFEDNDIEWTEAVTPYTSGPAAWASGRGGRWVGRFNTITVNMTTDYWQGPDIHGNNGNTAPLYCEALGHCDDDTGPCGGGFSCAGGNRGVMVVEHYFNVIDLSNGDQNVKALDIRGGTVMDFANNFVYGGLTKRGYTQIREEDGADGICCSGGISNWESCCDPVRDTYIFANRNSPSALDMFAATLGGVGSWVGESPVSEAEYVEPDYNYWEYEASFDGTTGVGRGTRAQMDAITTCTQYTAFWVTDEGEWNSENGGNDGRLYRCNASNTWVLYYTPYDYPHPLRGGPPPTLSSAISGGSMVNSAF